MVRPSPSEKAIEQTEDFNPATVMGAQPKSPFLDQQNVISCNTCGYPNTHATAICLQCKAELAPGKNISQKKGAVSNQNHRLVKGEGADSSDPDLKKTIDPYRQKKEIACFLKMIGESEDETQVIKCTGTKVTLNRGNLDPDNMTITSKVQAEIEFRDGEFFIQDKSDKKTTFIQVNQPHSLKDGDIILLGNRKFLFSKTDNQDNE